MRDHSGEHQDHENTYGHDHAQDLGKVSRMRLWWALAINSVFLVIEVVGGILSGSLALLADAGHMLTDVAALALALMVSYIALRPPTPQRTYGLLRAEVMGAFINAVSLFLIVGLILREAWLRLGQHQEIQGSMMLAVAVAGLGANLVSAVILRRSKDENVNMEGAYLHMIADALGSVGAIVAGIVIWAWGWMAIDPIMSVVISLLILWSSWGLLKRTTNILLESTPEDIDYSQVLKEMEKFEHVVSVHDLHIWTLASGMPVMTAHLVICKECRKSGHWEDCRIEIEKMIEERFGITHLTLQIEAKECENDCMIV